jgi:hypothetical protein
MDGANAGRVGFIANGSAATCCADKGVLGPGAPSEDAFQLRNRLRRLHSLSPPGNFIEKIAIIYLSVSPPKGIENEPWL